ncbi:MAG: hypothetical protein DCC75_09945, partial [Proteobacteria bacterium]
MSGISLNSNIYSLLAQRRLSSAGSSLQKSFERLSSGQRINRPSDDAAGLAVSSGLRNDTRVFTQGLRNVNDGISAINVASGATGQLTNILHRLKELATSASNGTFVRTQRVALNNEATQLVNEYNRILGSTKFNGLGLLNGSLNSMRIQGGYGTNGGIGLSLGAGLTRNSGWGDFTTGADQQTAMNEDMVSGDINNDGKVDLIGINLSDEKIYFHLGNGDGTFGRWDDLGALSVGKARNVKVADLNNDGKLDVISDSQDFGPLVFIGNGNGTFRSGISLGIAGGSYAVEVGDFNGDSILDIAAGVLNDVRVSLGRGDGTFNNATLFSTNIGSNITNLVAGDFNGDGAIDLVAGDGTLNQVIQGSGTGTFTARYSFALGSGLNRFSVGDFNRDGISDLVIGDLMSGEAFGLRGSTSGTLTTTTTFSGLSYIGYQVNVGDYNNDGLSDIITEVGVVLGNGNGTFGSMQAFNNLGVGGQTTLGDFNGDGILDIAGMESGTLKSSLGGVSTTTTMQYIDLASRSGAFSALSIIEQAINRVSTELGTLGVGESRLNA